MEILLKTGVEAPSVSTLSDAQQVYALRVLGPQKAQLDALLETALRGHHIPVIHGEVVAYFGAHARTIVHHIIQNPCCITH
jgi:hypothetical protein